MGSMLLEPIVQTAQPWADLYGDSTLLQTGILFTHFAGLLTAGGFAVASDRLALRISRERGPGRDLLLHELSAVHRPVLIGLAVVTVTGLAMAFADAEYLLVSKVFWLKMAAFALLLLNGAWMVRTERRLRAGGVSGSVGSGSPEGSPTDASSAPRSGHIALSHGWDGDSRDPADDAVRSASSPDAGSSGSAAGAGAATATAAPPETAGGRPATGSERSPAERSPDRESPAPEQLRAWKSLRWTAVRSMALWGLTLLLGTALTAI